MMTGNMSYYILIGIIGLVSSLVSGQLKRKFAHYSKIQLRNGMTGAQIAEKMLADHGITDVEVISTPGQLTDHYNPTNKTVNLSEVVYGVANASSAAVAAHEVGHAVQHATAYKYLAMRSKLVPVVNISSKMSQYVIMGGVALMATQAMGVMGQYIAIAGLVLMGAATAFSFITLPVEYDASNRALAWLKNKNMVTQEEYKGSEDALKWAARTYLVAAIGSLASLLYWVVKIVGRRN